MKRLHGVIANALNELGESIDMSLGSKTKAAELIDIEDWRDRLEERLYREAKVYKGIFLGIHSACLILFFVGLFVLFYYWDNPGIYQLIFGGGSLTAMLAVLNMARLTLIDKAYCDIMIPMISTLPADQVVIVLKNLKNTRFAD